MGKTYHGAFCDNFGVKKVEAPSKNPKKCPIICFAPDKKIISRTIKIRGTLVRIFLSQKERGGERARAKVRARARARAGKGKGKGKRERELKCW